LQKKIKTMKTNNEIVTIKLNDTVKTKHGIGLVVDVIEWNDGITNHIEYDVETQIGSYRLMRSEIEK